LGGAPQAVCGGEASLPWAGRRNLLRKYAWILFGYAFALLVSGSLYALHVPLAWLLGSLVAAAGLALSGLPVEPPTGPRRLGQLAIGATVGLNMTAAVLLQVAGWLPMMVVTALVMITVSAAFSVLLARLARLDVKTAFFANLPGGLAEMGNVGGQIGAHPEPIAIVQSLRVALIVIFVPPVLVAFGSAGAALPPGAPPLPAPQVLILLALGSVGALILHLARLNNPWTIGSMICAAALTAGGFAEGRMPPPVFFAAQLLVGYAVGARFRPAMIWTLPRVTAGGVVTIVGIAAVMVGYSALMAALTDLDLVTAILATSPGGMSEMVAAAQTLHLSVALVVAFQMVRALMVNSFATYYWAAFSRSGFLGLVERLVGKPPTSGPTGGA
jgi:membrane AbrB-like protein